MPVDHFARERVSVEIAEALNRLLDADVPFEIVKGVYDGVSEERFDRRLILSLVQRLWPDPDQCPDGC